MKNEGIQRKIVKKPPAAVRGVHGCAAPRDACGSGGGKAHRSPLTAAAAAARSTDAQQDAQTPLPPPPLDALNSRDEEQRRVSAAQSRSRALRLIDGSAGQSGAAWEERLRTRANQRERREKEWREDG